MVVLYKYDDPCDDITKDLIRWIYPRYTLPKK